MSRAIPLSEHLASAHIALYAISSMPMVTWKRELSVYMRLITLLTPASIYIDSDFTLTGRGNSGSSCRCRRVLAADGEIAIEPEQPPAVSNRTVSESGTMMSITNSRSSLAWQSRRSTLMAFV